MVRRIALTALFVSVASGVLLAASLPGGCLVEVTVRNAARASKELGRLTAALSPELAPSRLREMLATFLGAAGDAQVDFRAPVRVYLFAAKKRRCVWAFVYLRPGTQAAESRRVVRCADPATARKLERWIRRHTTPTGAEAPDITARVNLSLLIETFDEEVKTAAKAMKRRMQDAISFAGRPPAEGRAAQSDLDLALLALRQVASVELTCRLSGDTVVLRAKAQLRKGRIARLVASHPPGAIDLLALCPADAAVAAMHDLDLPLALTRSLGALLGVANPDGERLAAPRQRLGAVFLNPAPRPPFDLLLLTRGESGRIALASWDRIAGGRQGGSIFRLRPLPVPKPDADHARLAVLEALPALGPRGERAFRRLLGEAPLAELIAGPDSSVVAIGARPWVRLAQVRGLGEGRGQSLLGSPAFRGSFRRLRRPPNALLYLAPSAIRGWLALGGARGAPPASHEAGLIASLALAGDPGPTATLVLPTTTLRNALGAAKRPGD